MNGLNNLAFLHIPKNAGTSIRSICPQFNILYYECYTDPKNIINEDVIVVLRDPIDRFCSAVNYAIKYWNKVPRIQQIIDLGLCSPNDWIHHYFDKDSQHHELIKSEITNQNNNPHKIGNYIPKYKWIYCPQYYYIHNPSYILIYDNLETEFNFLMQLYGKNKINIPKLNTTAHTNKLSDTSIEILKNFYSIDYSIYEGFKNQNYQERIKLHDWH